MITVPEYRVRLANGAVSTSKTLAIADLTLVSLAGAAKLPQVHFNVIPGRVAPLLVGRIELRRLGIPILWDLIDQRITEERSNKIAHTAKAADELDDWRRRRLALRNQIRIA